MRKIFLILTIWIVLLSPLFLVSCNIDDTECLHKNTKLSTHGADCDSEGYILHKCSDCGFEYKSDIKPPKGHSLSTQTIAPTCSSEGYTLYSCECGYNYKADFVSPVAHELSKKTVAPTCSTEGYTLYLCKCGYNYKSDFVAPIAHTLSKDVVAPTCSKQGYTEYTCACGYKFKSDYTSPTGHVLSSEIISPTCVDQGYTENLCSVCSYSFISDYTKPLGHDFITTVTRPTSSSTGFTKFVCHCDYEYTGEYIMASDIFKGAYVDGEEVLAHGIDISNWNGVIKWQEIKNAGIDFVIIKAGSTNGKDPAFELNYQNAKEAGLDVGCYFYTYATTIEEIEADADAFMNMIVGKKFEYPIYLDIEDPSQETLDEALLTKMCVTFIEKLQLNGYFGAIYANNNWLVNLLHTETITTYFDVWLARWTLSGEANWGSSFGTRMGMWQYSCTGKIGSHSCDFDMNVAFKDYPSLIKEWGYNGY